MVQKLFWDSKGRLNIQTSNTTAGGWSNDLLTDSCAPSRITKVPMAPKFRTEAWGCTDKSGFRIRCPAKPLRPPTPQQRVVPVCDNAVLDGILQGQDASLRLCLVAEAGIKEAVIPNTSNTGSRRR